MKTTTSPSRIARRRAVRVDDRGRLDELVGSRRARRRPRAPPRAVAAVNGASPSTSSVVGRRDALPALVAVHRVVAAADRSDARARRALRADALHEGERCGGALRRRVAAVEERVHADVAHARARPPCRPSRRSAARGCARRPATARPSTCSVAPLRARGVDGVVEHRVARELAGRDRVVDARVVLVDDAARADVEVTDLGVAHLARRAGRREARTRRSSCADTSRAARPSSACAARAIALSGASSRQPKPSRISSTTGARTRADGAAVQAAGGRWPCGRSLGASSGSARVRYHFSLCLALPPRCACRSLRKNWLLILVVRSLSGAMLVWPLVQRRLSPMKESARSTRRSSSTRATRSLLDVREPKEFDRRRACRTRCTFRCRSSRRGGELAQVMPRAGHRLLRARPAQPAARRRADESRASRRSTA